MLGHGLVQQRKQVLRDRLARHLAPLFPERAPKPEVERGRVLPPAHPIMIDAAVHVAGMRRREQELHSVNDHRPCWHTKCHSVAVLLRPSALQDHAREMGAKAGVQSLGHVLAVCLWRAFEVD